MRAEGQGWPSRRAGTDPSLPSAPHLWCLDQSWPWEPLESLVCEMGGSLPGGCEDHAAGRADTRGQTFAELQLPQKVGIAEVGRACFLPDLLPMPIPALSKVCGLELARFPPL